MGTEQAALGTQHWDWAHQLAMQMSDVHIGSWLANGTLTSGSTRASQNKSKLLSVLQTSQMHMPP